jgi:predicted  nucleic acid-binding Zn-ribbon protein
MCSFDEWYEGREWCRNWKSDAQTAWDAALEAAEASLEMHKADNEICRSAMDNLANKLFAAEQEVKRLQEQYENRTPTEWAYEQACKALEIWHGEANRLKDELAKAMKVVEAARYVDDESGADGLWELSMALREFDSERG